jgi:hypothetical protein
MPEFSTAINIVPSTAIAVPPELRGPGSLLSYRITALNESSVSDAFLFPALWMRSSTLFTIPNPLILKLRG